MQFGAGYQLAGPLMPLIPRTLLRPSDAAGEEWSVLGTFDFSTAGASDWTSAGGNVTIAGVQWDSQNHLRTDAFGPDGSTGIDISQHTNGNLENGSAPGITTALSNIGTVGDGDELCVELRADATSAGNYGRLVIAVQDTDYTAAGAVYLTSPGQWEAGSISSPTQYTDQSTALADSSDFVLQAVFTASGVVLYDRGSWSGSWPSDVGGAVVDAVGTEAGNPATDLKPQLSAAALKIVTYRSSSTTVAKIRAVRVRRRVKGA